jgi:hypothetical protein
LLPLTLVMAGCGNDEAGTAGRASGDTVTSAAPPSSSGLPPCAEARHLAVFDVFGFLSMSDGDLRQWMDDPTDTPDVRLGTPEAVNTYRSLGYEILYVTTVSAEATVDGEPIDEAIGRWLTQHNFPGGEGTSLVVKPSGDATGISDRLLAFAREGVSVDVAYTDNRQQAYAAITGGVPPGRTFTLGSAAGAEGSRAIPEDDVIAHSQHLADLPRVCDLEGS